MRSIFSSIFNLEKLGRIGLVEIEIQALNGGRGKIEDGGNVVNKEVLPQRSPRGR